MSLLKDAKMKSLADKIYEDEIEAEVKKTATKKVEKKVKSKKEK